MARESITEISASVSRPAIRTARPPIEVRNEIVIHAPVERVWAVLTDVERWPSWYRACKWVRVESTGDAAGPVSFRWKAHPVELRSTVVASERPHLFAIDADTPGIHAERAFSLRPTAEGRGTVDQTQPPAGRP